MTSSKSDIKTTIIIPTSRRPKILRETLASYVHANPEEIIIVSNGQIQEYEALIQWARNKWPNANIRNVSTHKASAAVSRNIGIANASHSLIIFGEDDAYITENYVQNVRNRLIEDPLSIASGVLINLKHTRKLQSNLQIEYLDIPYADKFSSFFDERLLFIKPDVQPLVEIRLPFTHALFGYRKDIYRNVRFCENFTSPPEFREETSAQMLIARLSKNPLPAILLPNTYALHMSRAVTANGNRTSPWIYFIRSVKDNTLFINLFWEELSVLVPHRKKLTVAYRFAWFQTARMIRSGLTKLLR